MAALAPATSAAPRYLPVMAWPAIAIASRANASSVQSRNAIWWAAIASSPIRAAIAVVTTSTACSEIVRTTSAAPATAAARTPARSGPKATPARRAPLATMAR